MTPVEVIIRGTAEIEAALRDALEDLDGVRDKLALPAMADLRCTDAREQAMRAAQSLHRGLELLGAKR